MKYPVVEQFRMNCAVSLVLLVTCGVTPMAAAAGPDGHDHDPGIAQSPDQIDVLVRPDPSRPLIERDAATAGMTISDGPFADVIKNLAPSSRGERIGPDATTDVWALGKYAYTGTFNAPCGGEPDAGIFIWDVHNHNKVTQAGFIPSPDGSRSNDVKVASMNSGDVLVHSNESCADGPGGFEIYNVDDPANPVHLGSVRSNDVNETINSDPILGPFVQDAGVHNLWLFSQGDRDYAAAVFETWFGNFQIWDITEPRAPFRVGVWGAEELCTLGPPICSDNPLTESDPNVLFNHVVTWMLGGFGASSNRLLHDITISEDGAHAYLSNWDAGLVLLDISDPANSVFVSTALDPVNGSLDGEVNSHAAWPSEDGSVVVETEEDFSVFASLEPFRGNFGTSPANTIPGVGMSTRAGDDFEANPLDNNVTVTASSVTVNSGPLEDNTYPALEFVGSQPRLADVSGSVSGAAVWIGLACDAATTENAGVFPSGGVAIARRGVCLFATKLASAAALGASAIVISNNVLDTTWGGVRIWDYSDPTNPVLASTFDTVCSADPNDPSCDPRGTYSVHNVIVEDDKAYISWYSDGVLILDISDPYNPVETARYHREGPDFESKNGGIQDVWGIYKIENLPWIYASDRNGGLYVLKEYGAGSAKRGKR